MNTTLLKQEQDRMQKEIDLLIETAMVNRSSFANQEEIKERVRVNNKLEALYLSKLIKQEKTK